METFARARLAVLLALFHARITGQETLRLERGPEVGVELEQRAGDAVADRSRLAGMPAAVDIDTHVEFGQRFGGRQRLQRLHAQRLGKEIIFHRPAIDEDFART